MPEHGIAPARRNRWLRAIVPAQVAIACAAILVAAGCDSPASPDEPERPVLNIYNWSDYIAPGAVEAFEARTGIEVRYDVFDSNEMLETKLLAGSTGYDIVVPTVSFMERQIYAGAFAEIDRSKLPNYKNLDPELLERISLHDPGNRHGVPYVWGTTGFAYNRAKVQEIFPAAPLDSWDMLFRPEVVKRFAQCGVTMLDAPTEVVDAVLAWLGLEPNSHDPEHLARVEETLHAVRPYVRYFHSSQAINDIANGEVCLSMGWSGDMLQARDRAVEAGNGIDIGYSIPREGTIMWVDMLAIPIDARHKNNAHLFIDYMLEGEVIAAVTNFINYANPNLASLPFVRPEIRDDPVIFPPPDVRARLFPDLAETPAVTRRINRAWTRVKTGR